MLKHNNIMALCAGMLLRIKVIVFEHITLGEVLKTGEGKRMPGVPVAPMVSIFYGFADRVIAVSEWIRLIEEFRISLRIIRAMM
jgi:hypothetical protein